MNKPLNYKDPSEPMTLEEATAYLKKIDEWESVVRMDRETILSWAEFLKKREKDKLPTKLMTRKINKKTED